MLQSKFFYLGHKKIIPCSPASDLTLRIASISLLMNNFSLVPL